MLKKLFIFLIKYIPVIQMAGIIINNVMYLLENRPINLLIDFIFGNSITTTLLFYICSYIFKFCYWHKLVITCNLINISLVTLDSIISFKTTNEQQILLYFTIDIIFIILILINKFKCKS